MYADDPGGARGIMVIIVESWLGSANSNSGRSCLSVHILLGWYESDSFLSFYKWIVGQTMFLDHDMITSQGEWKTLNLNRLYTTEG